MPSSRLRHTTAWTLIAAVALFVVTPAAQVPGEITDGIRVRIAGVEMFDIPNQIHTDGHDFYGPAVVKSDSHLVRARLQRPDRTVIIPRAGTALMAVAVSVQADALLVRLADRPDPET